MIDHFLWVEKYRPKTVAECILPAELKKTFQAFVDQKNIPHLQLSGGAGMGKTSVARAMVEEIGCDYIMINGSKDGNIDTLRTTIQNFASTMSFKGGRKYVILDEADYLTHHTQPALRNFMEEFSRNCGFILTCNYPNRIIEPLWSRNSCISFHIAKEEIPQLAMEFFHRVKHILGQENVEYDKAAVVELIKKHFPDFRRTLNELQRHAAKGKITADILQHAISIESLVKHMKEKNFTSVRQWTTENLNGDSSELYRNFYDDAAELFTPDYIPMLVLTLAKYQYQASFALDQEINFAAFCAEIMVEASWKRK